MRFKVYGPFELWRWENGLISRNKVDREDFWDEVEAEEPGLSGACGCMAISRNPDLLNIRGTKMIRELEVEGFLNTDRRARSGPAKQLRDTLGG